MNNNSFKIEKAVLNQYITDFIKKTAHEEQDLINLAYIFHNQTNYFDREDIPILSKLIRKIETIPELEELTSKIEECQNLNSGDIHKALSYLKSKGHEIKELDLTFFSSLKNNDLKLIIEYCPNLNLIYLDSNFMEQIDFSCLQPARRLDFSFVNTFHS